MNTTMIDTRDVILALKHVKKEKKLSLDKIHYLMVQQDPSTAVSKTTLSRIFSKGSEEQIFRYETTLRPIANALLDIETIETDDDLDTQAYKSILKLKKDIIEEFEEKLKDYEDLKLQLSHYQQTLELLHEQIKFKDSRIDKLLSSNERLTVVNDRLTERLISCPCRKEGAING